MEELKTYQVDLCYRTWDQHTVTACNEQEAIEKAIKADPNYKLMRELAGLEDGHHSATRVFIGE